MDNGTQEMKTKAEQNEADETRSKKSLEGLPIETSPYVQYKDLEDYKLKGYGTEGHLEPKLGPGAGASTDAPTLSGGAPPSATNAINRQGVP